MGVKSSKRRGPIRWMLWIPLGLVLLAIFLMLTLPLSRWLRFKAGPVVYARQTRPNDPSLVLVTAYCNCGLCCSWRPRYWFFGDPIISVGPRKGQPKEVGRTASGHYAGRGTVAADLKVFPMGTKLVIPGYGEGRVEDTGGAVKGRHIDVWFPTHAEALEWGAQWLPVKRRK